MTMTMPTETAAITWHYVLTVTWPMNRGQATVTTSGCFDVPPGGATRTELFELLMKQRSDEIEHEHGVRPRLNVLFFALEPDRL